MNLRLPIFILTMALGATFLLPANQSTDESVTASYRDWHLGMSLADAAKPAAIDSSTAKLISARPQRVEELSWRTGGSSSQLKPDSVREILFRFYNGGLSEMMITYDRSQTSGMTDDDMRDALTAVYGPSSPPTINEMRFNSGYENTARIVAEWGAQRAEGQNLVRLVALSYDAGYGLVVSSTATQALVRTALLESERLDHVEGPQKERDLKARRDAETKAQNEKSRLQNKPGFRP